MIIGRTYVYQKHDTTACALRRYLALAHVCDRAKIEKCSSIACFKSPLHFMRSILLSLTNTDLTVNANLACFYFKASIVALSALLLVPTARLMQIYIEVKKILQQKKRFS